MAPPGTPPKTGKWLGKGHVDNNALFLFGVWGSNSIVNLRVHLTLRTAPTPGKKSMSLKESSYKSI